jgi:Holliday junction resolvase
MVDSRDKGSRAETAVKKTLKDLTGLDWQRTPGSGALDAKHLMKGDLYLPGIGNVFCVEVKHYQDDHLTSKILTDKVPQLFHWWEQCKRQADQVNREPLLIFKFDRSKMFCAFELMPNSHLPFMYVSRNGFEFYVAVLEDWIELERPQFVC